MLELTIKEQVYQFNFGMGFVREINKKVTRTPSAEISDAKQNIGLQFAVAGLIDKDPETLVDVLDIANKYADKPRVSRMDLDFLIENDETDLDALFAEVMDFLESANATRQVTANVKKMVEEEMAKMEQQKQS